MAYQDVFATITDINGTRQSYSCRRKVNWVTANFYYSNNAQLMAHTYYDPSKLAMPTISLARHDHKDEPVTIDITQVLGSNTTLKIGDYCIDLSRLDIDTLAPLIAAYKLSA